MGDPVPDRTFAPKVAKSASVCIRLFSTPLQPNFEDPCRLPFVDTSHHTPPHAPSRAPTCCHHTDETPQLCYKSFVHSQTSPEPSSWKTELFKVAFLEAEIILCYFGINVGACFCVAAVPSKLAVVFFCWSAHFFPPGHHSCIYIF